MSYQGQIDFTAIAIHRENNPESEATLNANIERLSRNCKIIYDALMRGEKLTGATIVSKYGMLEYRRRIKDLRAAGIQIKEEQLSNGCKIWSIEK